MKCPKCGVEAAIVGTRMETAGDQSPDTQTEVWAVMQYRCRNPVCPAFESMETVGETRHRVYPEEETGDASSLPQSPPATQGEPPEAAGRRPGAAPASEGAKTKGGEKCE